MTITILCAGALARPGAQRADIEADPTAPQAAWLPAARLRNEVRSTSRTPIAVPSDDSALARALRRASVVSRSHLDDATPRELPDEQWLRERFDLEGTVAACTLPPADAPELVVRPVHLHPGLDQVMLAPPGQLSVDDSEARLLADAANRWLADDDLYLSPQRPDVWALRARGNGNGQGSRDMAALGALQAPSARTASGRNIGAWQASGAAASRWRQLDTLIQMSWFEHPVNEARLAQGRLPITGPWLEGRAGAARARAFDHVWTDDDAIEGLARRAGADARRVRVEELVEERIDPSSSRGAAARERAQQAGATTLIAPGFWRRAAEDGDTDAWVDGWLAFERWFEQGLSKALAHADLRLVLTGERDTVELALSRSDRFRVWRALRVSSLLEG